MSDKTLDSLKESLTQTIEEIDSLRNRINISDRAMKNLHDLYAIIWTEACYDPYNDRSQETATRCLPLIQELNKELGFKK